MADTAHLACTYAALILYDDGQDITGISFCNQQEIKSPPQSTPPDLKSSHTGQNSSPRPLKDKTSPPSSASVDPLNQPQPQLPHLPQLQNNKLRKMRRKERRKSHHHQRNNKKTPVWEVSLIELFKLYYYTQFYSFLFRTSSNHFIH